MTETKGRKLSSFNAIHVRGEAVIDGHVSARGVVQPALRYFLAEMSQDGNQPIELRVSLNTIGVAAQSYYLQTGLYSLDFPLGHLSAHAFVMVTPDDNSYQLFAYVADDFRVEISTQVGGVAHNGQMTNAKIMIIDPIE
jgi:hypothetical protein